MISSTPLQILSAALDELTDGQIVLRGVIDPGSLGSLQKPTYQRETLRKDKIQELVEALRSGSGRVPDVELAVCVCQLDLAPFDALIWPHLVFA